MRARRCGPDLRSPSEGARSPSPPPASRTPRLPRRRTISSLPMRPFPSRKVKGLELHVRQRGLDQRRYRLGLVVEESLEVFERIRQRIDGRWHERGVSGTVPPSQTCDRRISPGVLPLPRGCIMSTLCMSRSRRMQIGKPERSFFNPNSSAARQRLTSRASSMGTPGCSSISYRNRSGGDSPVLYCRSTPHVGT
jgi:hypothetical protein